MHRRRLRSLRNLPSERDFCLQCWKKANVSQTLKEESTFLKPLKMAMPSVPLSRQRLHLGGFWRASPMIQ